MIIKSVCILLLAFCTISCFCQTPDARRDELWLLGNISAPSVKPLFDFSTTPFTQTASPLSPINTFLSNSLICDTSGQLLFYTNGWTVCNKNHQIMPNGDSLSLGDAFDMIRYSGVGNIIPQGTLTLPLPGSDHLYIIFHEASNLNLPFVPCVVVPGLLYSVVDMTKDDGLGEVVIKNQVALRDTLHFGMLTAARHANGRDWWILVPDYYNKGFHTILLRPGGLEFSFQMVQGLPSQEIQVGQAVFTPDGSRYIYFALEGFYDRRFEIYDFDRCSGTLSNQRDLTGIFQFAPADPYDNASTAVSSNSRYLYVSDGMTLFQFDLLANDIAASCLIIAEHDGFQWNNSHTWFVYMQLAPDGKIYLGAYDTPYLHVINWPDLPGNACDIQQHAINLVSQNHNGIPNFPNFRLGSLPGSPCDSLYSGIDNPGRSGQAVLLAYPNPAGEVMYFELDGNGLASISELFIYNALGELADRISFSPWQKHYRYQTRKLPGRGIYTAVLRQNDKMAGSVRFVIIR